MFKCAVCGAENTVGAVHCVNCGEKLDLDNLAPEIHVEDKEMSEVRAFVMRRSFLLVIWIVLFGTPLLTLIPPSGREVKEIKPAQLQKLTNTFVYFTKGMQRMSVMTADEFGAVIGQIYKESFSVPAYRWLDLEAKGVRVDITKDKKLKFVVKQSFLKGRISMYSSFTIDPNSPNEIAGISFGRLPIPEPLQGLITDPVLKELDKQPDLKETLGKVTKIRIDDSGRIILQR